MNSCAIGSLKATAERAPGPRAAGLEAARAVRPAAATLRVPTRSAPPYRGGCRPEASLQGPKPSRGRGTVWCRTSRDARRESRPRHHRPGSQAAWCRRRPSARRAPIDLPRKQRIPVARPRRRKRGYGVARVREAPPERMPSEPPGSSLSRRQPRGGLSGARRSRTETLEAKLRRGDPRRGTEATVGPTILRVKPRGVLTCLSARALCRHRESCTFRSSPFRAPQRDLCRGPPLPTHVCSARTPERRTVPWSETIPMTSCRSRTSGSSGRPLRPCSAGSDKEACGFRAGTSAENSGAPAIAASCSSGAGSLATGT